MEPFPFTHSTHTNPLNLLGVCPRVVTNANIRLVAQVTFDTVPILSSIAIDICSRRNFYMPKRDKSKRLQVVITEEQDSMLTKTAYQLSNPERLVSKSEVVRLGIEMLNRAVETGDLEPNLVNTIDEEAS